MWSRDVRTNNFIVVTVKNKCNTYKLKTTSFNGRFCLQQMKKCLHKNSKPCTRLAELLRIKDSTPFFKNYFCLECRCFCAFFSAFAGSSIMKPCTKEIPVYTSLESVSCTSPCLATLLSKDF